MNYNVGAPSTRIDGQANATHNRYQLSNEFADQSDSEEITLGRCGFRGGHSQVSRTRKAGSCERKQIKKLNIIIMIMIIIMIINTKFILFHFIDNHNYNTTKKRFNEDSLTDIRLKPKTIDYYNAYRH